MNEVYLDALVNVALSLSYNEFKVCYRKFWSKSTITVKILTLIRT
jgi:hypothetical protein